MVCTCYVYGHIIGNAALFPSLIILELLGSDSTEFP